MFVDEIETHFRDSTSLFELLVSIVRDYLVNSKNAFVEHAL